MVGAIIAIVISGGCIAFLCSSKAHRFNPLRAKCPACASKMRKHAWTWRWLIGDWVLWVCFWISSGLDNIKSGVLLILFWVVLAQLWVVSRDRLYHH